jgi:hypothetical protein
LHLCVFALIQIPIHITKTKNNTNAAPSANRKVYV